MKGTVLKARARDITGKKVRFLRRGGITPTHLFGHNLKSRSLECNTGELLDVIKEFGTTSLLNLEIDSEKRPRKVLIREIQTDPLGKQLLHVDLYQIKMTEKLKAEIPIILTGEAPAMEIKGRAVQHSLDTLSVECLPDKLPHEVEVNIGVLNELGDSIYVKDLRLGEDITVHNEPDQLIVKIAEMAVARVAEEEEEEAAAVEEAAPVEETEEEQTAE
ncbi:MAG: 50S ribosomal protein L25 [Dehalococcoidales bacterium]